MQYLGGKQRIAKHIVPVLEAELARPEMRGYVEPFIGGGSIFCAVQTDKPKVGADANADLIALWAYLANGGRDLPSTVTEEEYQAAKSPLFQPEWLRAFIGFGCSFGGKWFAGYARDPKTDRNYCLNGRNSLLKRSSGLRATDAFLPLRFGALATLALEAPEDGPFVWYCDPPYVGTTGYGAVGAWDAEAFWRDARALADAGHVVFVSEYTAPADVPCVLEIQTKTDLQTKGGKEPRVERLFRLGRTL